MVPTSDSLISARPACFWFCILFGIFVLFIAVTTVPVAILIHQEILIIRVGLTFFFPGLALLVGGVLCCHRHRKRVNRSENPHIQQTSGTIGSPRSPIISQGVYEQYHGHHYDTLTGGFTAGAPASTVPPAAAIYRTFPREAPVDGVPSSFPRDPRSHDASEGVYSDGGGVYDNTKGVFKNPVGIGQAHGPDKCPYGATAPRFPTETEMVTYSGGFPVESIDFDYSTTDTYQHLSDDQPSPYYEDIKKLQWRD